VRVRKASRADNLYTGQARPRSHGCRRAIPRERPDHPVVALGSPRPTRDRSRSDSTPSSAGVRADANIGVMWWPLGRRAATTRSVRRRPTLVRTDLEMARLERECPTLRVASPGRRRSARRIRVLESGSLHADRPAVIRSRHHRIGDWLWPVLTPRLSLVLLSGWTAMLPPAAGYCGQYCCLIRTPQSQPRIARGRRRPRLAAWPS
jgi:hypothetical protein